MFTGLIQACGNLLSSDAVDGGRRMTVGFPAGFLAGANVGDSIAVNGVCLTAIAIDTVSFQADVSAATLEVTTLARLQTGAALNLERAATPATALGGHLVTGHVDDVGQVTGTEMVGESMRLRIAVPARLARYVAAKGSICVDGVSLTVNSVKGVEFEVNLVPHTLAATNLGMLCGGAAVNIEVDLVARYVERLLERE